MRVDESTAKRYLNKLKEELGGLAYMELYHIGELIHKYWEAREWKLIKSKLK